MKPNTFVERLVEKMLEDFLQKEEVFLLNPRKWRKRKILRSKSYTLSSFCDKITRSRKSIVHKKILLEFSTRDYSNFRVENFIRRGDCNDPILSSLIP